MILKKVEKDGIVKCIYESSNILASTYNISTKELNIIFKNGGNYKYSGVPKIDYTIFELSDSQGKVLNSNIKQYSVVKEGVIDTGKILKEIEDVRLVELKNLELGMVSKMSEMVLQMETTNTFDVLAFEIILKMYEKYKII